MSKVHEHLAEVTDETRLKHERALRAHEDGASAKTFLEHYGHSHERTTGMSDEDYKFKTLARADKKGWKAA